MNQPFIPAEKPEDGVLGRRNAPRLQLRMPAKLISVVESQDCELIDVSLGGALLRLARPLPPEDCGYLRAGPLEAFAITVWAKDSIATEGLSAVQFDPPLTRAQINELRVYAREFGMIEQRARMRAAHDWVRGTGR